ncbi:MAG TPA: GNAT family N-acetyltransferase [Nocardioidaceae bacterium]|nr:GNAT family N-acetyltransferase [Nocardioidaceae bacterium]
MLWQVRASLEDRPGTLAALAVSCGEQLVNILGLQIFPAADGRVVDELVLHTPGGWGPREVEQLCAGAGAVDATVAECSPRALEDQPVRYLRAAQVVVEQPELLEEQLCRLLDAVPADGTGTASLDLDEGPGPGVTLSRSQPFTDTEAARATELRRLAAHVLGAGPVVAMPAPGPDSAETVTVRPGTAADARALAEMHARCSAETVHRRFHAPVPHLSPRLARALLEPAGGVSLVVTVGRHIVAAGMLGPDPETPGAAEVGVMVEDRWQRHGHGTRLLRALAIEAAHLGHDALTCMVRPDNDAVLPSIRRAGLRARVSFADGLTEYRIPLARLRGTAPLVALLHDRRELREVYPPADLLDQAIRDGA